MPMYQYKCDGCNKIVEKRYSMSQDHPRTAQCPVCKKYTAYRLFYNTSTHIPLDFGSTENKIKTWKKDKKKYY
jgi:putative FmdB family regulatory protein